MSINFSKKEILERIKEHYNLKNNAELARYLEVAPTTISSWITRNSIDYDRIFSKCEDADLIWLLTGETTQNKKEEPSKTTKAEEGTYTYANLRKKETTQILKTENEKLYTDNIQLKDKIIILQENIMAEIRKNIYQKEQHAKEIEEKNNEITTLKEKINNLENKIKNHDTQNK